MNRFLQKSPLPVVKFRIIDNPYNCTKNFFKYTFFIPLKINLLDKNEKLLTYSMFPKADVFDKKKIYKNIDHLFQNYFNNIQTAKLEEGNVNIEYVEPFLIKEKCLGLSTFVAEQRGIVDINNIHFSDIHIKLEQNQNKNYINFPIWKKED